MLIEGCTFDTGDDCIALKSGRNDDGRRVNVPIENVDHPRLRDEGRPRRRGDRQRDLRRRAQHLRRAAAGWTARNLDRALRIKTNSVRGGVVEHVYMRDVTVGQVAEAVVTVNFFYEEGDTGKFPPTVRDVEVRNVTSRKSRYALLLRGYDTSPISDVRIVDCTFDGVAKAGCRRGREGSRPHQREGQRPGAERADQQVAAGGWRLRAPRKRRRVSLHGRARPRRRVPFHETVEGIAPSMPPAYYRLM